MSKEALRSKKNVVASERMSGRCDEDRLSRYDRSVADSTDESDLQATTLTVSQRLSRFALCLDFDAIPEAVVEQAKHLIVDAVGIALASTRYDYARSGAAALETLAGSGNHVVLGMKPRLPLRDAAFLNGILIHGLDYDDTHIPGIIHPTASIFPAALGAASHGRASGRDLLRAYVAALECAARIAAAASGAFHDRGFHPTGVVGTFGAAIAAGRLWGLDEETLTMAQGISLSFASGSLEFVQEGAATKRIHAGHAAACGLTATIMAKEAFTGPRRAYEGGHGLFGAYSNVDQIGRCAAAATQGLGERWETMAVALKPYPTCHFTHSAADAALFLRHRHGFTAEQVEHMTVQLPREVMPIVCEPRANKIAPLNGYDARFSVPYVVAAALIWGKLGLRELEDDSIRDPAVLDLAKRVECRPDPHSAFPRHYSAELTVMLKNGRSYTQREQINRGSEEQPLSHGEIINKYMDNAVSVLRDARAQRICETILTLERVDDVSSLSTILAG